jgi:hypothetical protein
MGDCDLGVKATIRAFALLNRAGRRGEHIVCVRPDQPNGTNHYYQDHGQHHGVLCYILALVVSPEPKDEIDHGNPSA